MVSNPIDWRARTVVSFDWGHLIEKPVTSPEGATSSVLQKMVGQLSFSMRGLANCSKVSESITTWDS